VSRYPERWLVSGSGEGFDLPTVGPIFEEYVASFGLRDRLRFRVGSFFTDPLPAAVVLVMGMVLHDWNLETNASS
jgi:hypothetical protein